MCWMQLLGMMSSVLRRVRSTSPDHPACCPPLSRPLLSAHEREHDAALPLPEHQTT